jgi:hypothetical protein
MKRWISLPWRRKPVDLEVVRAAAPGGGSPRHCAWISRTAAAAPHTPPPLLTGQPISVRGERRGEGRSRERGRGRRRQWQIGGAKEGDGAVDRGRKREVRCGYAD